MHDTEEHLDKLKNLKKKQIIATKKVGTSTLGGERVGKITRSPDSHLDKRHIYDEGCTSSL